MIAIHNLLKKETMSNEVQMDFICFVLQVEEGGSFAPNSAAKSAVIEAAWLMTNDPMNIHRESHTHHTTTKAKNCNLATNHHCSHIY